MSRFEDKVKELLNKYGSIEKVIMVVGGPCYISFESALFEYGVKSRGPLGYQCATLSGEMVVYIGQVLVEFIRIPEDYFFGYFEQDGVLWAEPEKALVDYLYWCECEGEQPDLYDIEWSMLNRDKVEKYAETMDIKLKLPDPTELRKWKHPKYHLLADEIEEFLGKNK